MSTELKEYPKRNTKFFMEDFFQTDVDDFSGGNFLFLSAKEVKVITDEEMFKDAETIEETGIILSTYCYNYREYMKFLFVEFKMKPWHNCYAVRRGFTRTMPLSWMAFQGGKQEILEWMEIKH